MKKEENKITCNDDEIVKTLASMYPYTYNNELYFIMRVNADNEYDFYKESYCKYGSIFIDDFTDDIRKARPFYGDHSRENAKKMYDFLNEEAEDETYRIIKFSGKKISEVFPHTLKESIIQFFRNL